MLGVALWLNYLWADLSAARVCGILHAQLDLLVGGSYGECSPAIIMFNGHILESSLLISFFKVGLLGGVAIGDIGTLLMPLQN